MASFAQLLRTKLYIPSIRQNALVPRAALLEKLNQGLGGKLTILSAPPGFGKSTLLAQWIQTSLDDDTQAAWLSLDETDNDWWRFWAHFSAAIALVTENNSVLPDEGLFSSDEFLTDIINQLHEQSNPLVVVIDDFHLIENNTIYESLDFLIAHLPHHSHLVIASRVEPPLTLARLRANGQLQELHVSHLRFSMDEIQILFNKQMGFSLSTDEIEHLNTFSEGWIASLQLVALSLRERPPASNLSVVFSETQHHVFEYLAEETLSKQSPLIADFLLKVSVLDQFCASLCEALTGNSGSRAILKTLESQNGFIVPLDSSHEWFRFHPLMRDYLQKTLASTLPSAHPSLLIKASTWYSAQNLPREAIEYALRAGDFQLAIPIILTIGRAMLRRSEQATLIRWLEAIPKEDLDNHPELWLIYAWALEHSLIFEDIPSALERVEIALANQMDTTAQLWRGEIAAIRASVLVQHGETDKVIPLCEEALNLLRPESLFIRGNVLVQLALAYSMNLQTEKALALFEEAMVTTRASGNIRGMFIALRHTVRIKIILGQFHEAQNLCNQTFAAIESGDLPDIPASGAVHLAIAPLAYYQNQLEKAEAHLMEVIRRSKSQGENLHLLLAYRNLAEIRAAQRRFAEAHELINKAESLAFGNEYYTYRNQFYWLAGDFEAAQELLQRKGFSIEKSLESSVSDYNYTILAKVEISQGHYAQAWPLVEYLLVLSEERRSQLSRIEKLILKAFIKMHLNDPNIAFESFTESLQLAAPANLLRSILELRPYVVELMPMFMQKFFALTDDERPHVSMSFLNALMHELDQGQNHDLPFEALSEREIEILELVANGLSNPQIGQNLFIGTETVKWHLKNIYRKLDVSNRIEATTRARYFGLLP